MSLSLTALQRCSIIGLVGSAHLDDVVRVAVYRLFIDLGRAPVAAEVARSIIRSPVAVEEAFRRLHEAHLLVLAQGSDYIWMANPFSALPTAYSVNSGDRRFWGNCIWDALGILAVLGSDGSVAALCPDCGEELHLEVREGNLVPTDHVVNFTVPARHWWDDIGFN